MIFITDILAVGVLAICPSHVINNPEIENPEQIRFQRGESFIVAYLVKMYLEGLNYNQMAERSLGHKDNTQKQLDKKINAIKKQFTRSRTGSLAKFKSCLERVMRKTKLIQEDMLN